MRSFSLVFQPRRGPRSSVPVPSLHGEGSRALTKTHRVQTVHLVRPRTGGLGKLGKPELQLQGGDTAASPPLANHGAGISPSGPPINRVNAPPWFCPVRFFQVQKLTNLGMKIEQQSVFHNQYCKHPQSAAIVLMESLFLLLLL